jgi:hypothetical protein
VWTVAEAFARLKLTGLPEVDRGQHVLGGPVLLIAGTLGAGVLVYRSWTGLRGAGKPHAAPAAAA